MNESPQISAGGLARPTLGALTEPPLSPPVLGTASPAVQPPSSEAAPSLETPALRAPAAVAAAPQPVEPATPTRPLSQDDLAKLPLQALLVRAAYLTVDQLSQALSESVTSGRPVEEIAVERGWVEQAQVEQLVEARRAATTPTAAPLAAAPAVEPTPAATPAPAAPEPMVAQAEPEPIEPMVAQAEPEPIVPIQPVVVEAPPAQAAPVDATPQDVTAPQPVVPEPAQPTIIPQQPPPAPAAEAPAEPLVMAPVPPAPTTPAAPADVDPNATANTIAVFLHLTSGERLWVGRFDTQEDAEKHASELVDAIMRPEPGVWPRFGGRLIRPDAVVSIELSRRQPEY